MLQINDLRFWVAIGCSEEEKALPRCVSLDISIQFKEVLVATINDNVESTVCYADVVNRVKEFCSKKKFNLIEYLAGEVHRLVSEMIQVPVEITVKATKLLPPVQDIHGGVSFTYSAT
jgi:dihydroneopterin aldolase